MKYIKLFENKEFKDIDDYIKEYYEDYLDEEETFDSLIEKLNGENVDDFIEGIYHEIESDIADDICNHVNEHPYIDTNTAGSNWQKVLYDWIGNANAFRR
jgi:DNA-binding protein Fis